MNEENAWDQISDTKDSLKRSLRVTAHKIVITIKAMKLEKAVGTFEICVEITSACKEI